MNKGCLPFSTSMLSSLMKFVGLRQRKVFNDIATSVAGKHADSNKSLFKLTQSDPDMSWSKHERQISDAVLVLSSLVYHSEYCNNDENPHILITQDRKQFSELTFPNNRHARDEVRGFEIILLRFMERALITRVNSRECVNLPFIASGQDETISIQKRAASSCNDTSTEEYSSQNSSTAAVQDSM